MEALKYEIETVNCDLCGSNDYELLWKKMPWSTTPKIKQDDGTLIHDTDVICKKCGLIFKNPRMSKESLRQFYKKQYRRIFNSKFSDTVDVTKHDIAIEIINAVYRLDWFKKIKFDVENKDILDIGCSLGAFAQGMQEMGGNIIGLEPNDQYREFSTQWWWYPILDVTFEKYETDKKFDIISFTDGLEHVYSPTEILTKIWHMLKPDGYLLIEVPDVWFPYNNIDAFLSSAHTFTFSENTILSYLTNKCGFLVKQSSYDGHNRTLLILAQKKELPVGFINYHKMPDETKEKISSHLQKFTKLRAQHLKKQIKEEDVDKLLEEYSEFIGMFSIVIAFKFSQIGKWDVVEKALNSYKKEGSCDYTTSYPDYLFFKGTLIRQKGDIYLAHKLWEEAMDLFPHIDDYKFINYLDIYGILMKNQITIPNRTECKRSLGRL